MTRGIEEKTIATTKVFVGEGCIEQIAHLLKAEFECGSVGLIFESEFDEQKTLVQRSLAKGGYKVVELQCASSAQIEEYVRYFVSIGERSAHALASRLAKENGVGWSAVWCAPSHDELLQGFAPKQVFVDENILIKCQNEQIASGWGIVLSQPMRAFEGYFAHKVLDEEEDIEQPIFDSKSIASNSGLALCLLEISAKKRKQDSADIMAQVLLESNFQSHPRRKGELKLICASVLCAFYSRYLGNPCIDVLPPACIEDEGTIAKNLSIARQNDEKRIDFFEICSYFRINYILSEYRMDLIERLSGADFHTAQRFWRRLYRDAGFWIKNELDADCVVQSLIVAAAVSDNLLGYTYSTGFLADL